MHPYLGVLHNSKLWSQKRTIDWILTRHIYLSVNEILHCTMSWAIAGVGFMCMPVHIVFPPHFSRDVTRCTPEAVLYLSQPAIKTLFYCTVPSSNGAESHWVWKGCRRVMTSHVNCQRCVPLALEELGLISPAPTSESSFVNEALVFPAVHSVFTRLPLLFFCSKCWRCSLHEVDFIGRLHAAAFWECPWSWKSSQGDSHNSSRAIPWLLSVPTAKS